MNLLLIHQAFVSPKEAGGTRHYELAQHLLAEGHRVTIVASDLSYLTGRRTAAGKGLVTEEDVGGVRVLRAYTYPALHKSFVWRVVSFLSFMVTSVVAALRAGPVDVVMGTSPPIFQAASAYVVSRLRRRPFLLEIRDLWPEFAIDMGVLRNRWLIALSRWLEGFLYRGADHLIVNSPAYRDYLVRKGVPEKKVTLVLNGVEPGMFDPAKTGDAIRGRYALGDAFVVTYAGALGMANDLPTLLRAAGRLRNEAGIRFLLAGDGKERANLERLAAELELNNVIFAGALPKGEMAEVLAASDACVAILQNIPMFKTTYPNKVFDYMAAGRPTILGIDGVIRDVIDASAGGLFVPPGDDEALSQAVLRLAAAPEEGRAMGARARAYVVKHFDRARQAEVFSGVLARLGTAR